MMSNKVTPGSPQVTSGTISNKYPLSVKLDPRTAIFAGDIIRPGWKGIGVSGPYPHLLQPFHASLCDRNSEIAVTGSCTAQGMTSQMHVLQGVMNIKALIFSLLHKVNVLIFLFPANDLSHDIRFGKRPNRCAAPKE